jgi:hypothetical protein
MDWGTWIGGFLTGLWVGILVMAAMWRVRSPH